MRSRTSQAPLRQRIHYIVEWAERRGLNQADIGRSLAVDKSTVSRWFKGSVPTARHLRSLTALFCADNPAALFCHPDDHWLLQFLRGRSPDERERIRAILDAAFPPSRGAAA